jgi:hypothetical protein
VPLAPNFVWKREHDEHEQQITSLYRVKYMAWLPKRK